MVALPNMAAMGIQLFFYQTNSHDCSSMHCKRHFSFRRTRSFSILCIFDSLRCFLSIVHLNNSRLLILLLFLLSTTQLFTFYITIFKIWTMFIVYNFSHNRFKEIYKLTRTKLSTCQQTRFYFFESAFRLRNYDLS